MQIIMRILHYRDRKTSKYEKQKLQKKNFIFCINKQIYKNMLQ